MASSCTELEGEDGYSSIRGATLEKAKAELKEDPKTRGQAVRELRARIVQKENEVRSKTLCSSVSLSRLLLVSCGVGGCLRHIQ